MMFPGRAMNDRPLIRVLLVEDNPTDALLLREALAEAPSAKFMLTQVERLADGLARLREAPFDVVLLDLGLPDSSGADTVVRLHRQEPDVPVVVLTGLEDEAVGLQALQEGAQDYLVKNQLQASLLGRSIRYAIERHRIAAALRESELRLAGIIGSAMDGIITADERQRILLFNPAAERLFGCRAAEMLDQPLDRLIPERFRAAHVEHFHTFGQTNVTRRMMGELGVIYGRRADGEEFPIEAAISQVEVGGRKLFTVILRDITKRRRAEAALRESEERLRLFIEHAPAALAMFDREMRYLYVSRRWSSDYGLGERNLRGLPYYALFPEIPERWKAIHRRALGGEVVTTDADRFDRADGTVQWLRWEVRPWHDAAGEIGGIVVFSEDITARKRAEEALRDREAYLRAITQAVPDVLLVLDEEGRYLETLSAQPHLLYTEPAAFKGKLLGEVLPLEIARGALHSVRQTLLTRQTQSFDYELPVQKVGKRYFEARIAPLEGPMLDKSAVVVLARDVTPQRLAEESLRQAQKMESMGRLAGGVAHDFNNMLAVIAGHADLALEQTVPDSPLHADLLAIQQAAQRSADLTRQLLAFARKQIIAPQVLDLDDTIAGMLKMLGRLIGENIALLWKPATTLWPVRMDPTQINQILANLVVNARDAIAGVGQIIIKTDNVAFDETYCETHADFVPGPYVLLAVSDNGCGMDKAVLAQLFDPFFTTKPPGQGTGLGLATVYGIVRQNHGFIHVYSEPGHGTTFKIYLPRHAADPVGTGATRESAVAPTGTETVLLVEDEAALLALATRQLERLGYTVLAAGGPHQALQQAQAHTGAIHLLLTDVIMPDLSGRDLWQRLRALRPGLKCLFVSGYTADIIAHHGVLDDGVYFLQKPFSTEALATKLREALHGV